MSHMRTIGLTAAVALLVTGLIGGTVVLASERQQQRSLTADRTRESALTLQTAARTAQKKPAVDLVATPHTVTAGAQVTLRIRTATRHPRPVRIQRWDSKRRVWRPVTRRTVRATATVRVKPPTGTTRYRAEAARIRHRTGGKIHSHARAHSPSVVVTARAHRPRPTPAPPSTPPPSPASLSADETALLEAVTAARSTYARTQIRSAGDSGAEECLTAYARRHSAWMADQGAAADPGSAQHRAAKRSLPATDCPGRTVVALTRAVGVAETTTGAIALTVDAWLSSPYGETDRLLSACHVAPTFEYGVALVASGGTRWFTVLIASSTPDTRSSEAC